MDDTSAESTSAHVIVLGNEKGGSGKSTIALHLAIGLMQLGFRVAVADFDERQRSLHRYLENRKAYAADKDVALPSPYIYEPPDAATVGGTEARLARIDEELRTLRPEVDFMILDTPGAATPVAGLAHRLADTLITPVNDSLIDLDVLARLNVGPSDAQRPSEYSLMVLEEQQRRNDAQAGPIDWIVLRDRIAPLTSGNNERVGQVLEALAPMLGFRLGPGFSERVIYRELFLMGATVLDPIDIVAGIRPTVSHVAARIEVRQLLEALKLPEVTRLSAASAALSEGLEAQRARDPRPGTAAESLKRAG